MSTKKNNSKDNIDLPYDNDDLIARGMKIVAKHKKRANNQKRWNKVREMDDIGIKNDRILEKHYRHSNETNPVKTSILTDEGFKWGFNTAITTIVKEQRHIYWILDYGYSFTDKTNKFITLHYGNNPIKQYDPE